MMVASARYSGRPFHPSRPTRWTHRTVQPVPRRYYAGYFLARFSKPHVESFKQIAKPAQMHMGINESGRDGSTLGINSQRIRADMFLHIPADSNKFAILHCKTIRVRMRLIYRIDHRIFDHEISDLAGRAEGHKD